MSEVEAEPQSSIRLVQIPSLKFEVDFATDCQSASTWCRSPPLGSMTRF
jgi:hypothetical protein